MALEQYSRQARNPEAERQACELRLRLTPARWRAAPFLRPLLHRSGMVWPPLTVPPSMPPRRPKPLCSSDEAPLLPVCMLLQPATSSRTATAIPSANLEAALLPLAGKKSVQPICSHAVTWGGFGRPFFSPAYEELTVPSWSRPINWEMTVFTVYMATIVVCLVAILIFFELIDQCRGRQP